MATFTTQRNKIELKIKKVEPLALQNILRRIGASPMANTKELTAHINSRSKEETERVMEAISQLFGYCISQGVETDVPSAFIEELEAMGFPTSNKNIARLYWLRYVELIDQKEAGELVGAIIAHTFSPTEMEKKEFEEAIEE